ncbi:unnamed protein product [Dibothriocephalus latus]|uniref:Choline/carnitine acyltransferase domain-containing protein n=1 Tax=Dibothriocephalus latus TaxID=60516 RepID=A0A3P7NDR3_DIBLA|nr:unnamed protein product [Dibothriocephalus latus]
MIVGRPVVLWLVMPMDVATFLFGHAPKPKMPKTPHARRLDFTNFRQPKTPEALSREIGSGFATRVEGEVGSPQSLLKTSVYEAADKILGCTQRHYNDWISGRILQFSAKTARARDRNDNPSAI